MSKLEICKRREVVVLKDGKVQETFPSLQAFAFRYGKALNMATVSKRVKKHVDGWMPDGMVARYAGDEDEAGRMLQTSKSRKQEPLTDRAKWQQELDETEKKIQAAYDDFDAGLITIVQRHERLGWLTHHAEVLRNRIKTRSRRKKYADDEIFSY